MFCANCGMEETGDVVCCTHCGHPLVKTEETAKKMTKGKWAILAAVGVAVVSVIIVLSAVSKKDINKSAESVAIAGVEAEMEGDAEKLIQAYPDFAIRDLAWSILHLSENASEKEVLKALREYYSYQTTDKIKVINAEVLSEWTMEENPFYLDLYDETKEEREQIEKLASVAVTFLEGEVASVGDKLVLDEEEAQERTVTVLCVEMDKKWYYLRDI